MDCTARFYSYRSWYLNLIGDRIDRRMELCAFHLAFRYRWAAERENVWMAAAGTGCQKDRQEFLALPRFLDAACDALIAARSGDEFIEPFQRMWAAYRRPRAWSPPHLQFRLPLGPAVYQRQLPASGSQVYPCTVEDIRQKLERVPEWDLQGLWSIGLEQAGRDLATTYGCYYPRKWPTYKPVIVLPSQESSLSFKTHWRVTPGAAEKRFSVELRFGMRLDYRGCRATCSWPASSLRQYILEHVLLHELGHHVQHQQRLRAGHYGALRWVPSEQFAEDYALRMERRPVRRSSGAACVCSAYTGKPHARQ